MSDSELPNVNFTTIERMQVAAKNPNSGPVFMLNLNKYSIAAGFPDGALYKEYMQSISRLVSEVEGKILWRTPVNGQVVGSQDIDEVLGVWYPSHEALKHTQFAFIREKHGITRPSCQKCKFALVRSIYSHEKSIGDQFLPSAK